MGVVLKLGKFFLNFVFKFHVVFSDDPQFILHFFLCLGLILFFTHSEKTPEIFEFLFRFFLVILLDFIFLALLLRVYIKHHIFGHLLVILNELLAKDIPSDSNTKLNSHIKDSFRLKPNILEHCFVTYIDVVYHDH